MRNIRTQWVAVHIIFLTLSTFVTAQQRLATPTDRPHISEAALIAAKAGQWREKTAKRGLSFQGTYVNDWTLASANDDQDHWFGRYSFDFFLNVDGEKLLGSRGSCASVRPKQHL